MFAHSYLSMIRVYTYTFFRLHLYVTSATWVQLCLLKKSVICLCVKMVLPFLFCSHVSVIQSIFSRAMRLTCEHISSHHVHVLWHHFGQSNIDLGITSLTSRTCTFAWTKFVSVMDLRAFSAQVSVSLMHSCWSSFLSWMLKRET